jgi:hypothetical protein
MPAPRPVASLIAASLIAACALAAVLAGCSPRAPAAATAASSPAPVATAPSALATTLPATAAPAVPPGNAAPGAGSPGAASLATTALAVTPAAPAPAATAPAPAATPLAAGCATAAGAGLPKSSITVCPAAGPVGSVVRVAIKGCAPVGAGLPDIPAAGLFFLGPDSWLGTNGGGGASVPYAPQAGSAATATFTIPATYIGGNEDGPYPTLRVKPGAGYEFITDPAGQCHIQFTVTAP